MTDLCRNRMSILTRSNEMPRERKPEQVQDNRRAKMCGNTRNEFEKLINMGHKCYISFKTEDIYYKSEIQKMKEAGKLDYIDKSLNDPVDSENPDYIMRKIREDYLSDSTVTLFLIGTHSKETLGWEEQQYIKRELQASLFNGENNSRSGILGVVLPDMYDSIYKGSYTCSTCCNSHNWVSINDNTVIKEFSVNYYVEPLSGCSWTEDQRYCVLVKWDDFVSDPETYINKAYDKRNSDIASKVKVYPQ